MSGVDESDTVSSRNDEGISYITTPVQDGFDLPVIPLCDLASTEDTNTASVMSNPAQEDAPHGSEIVSGDFINGQQGTLEQNYEDKSDNQTIRILNDYPNTNILSNDLFKQIPVLKETLETLEKQKKHFEKLIDQFEKALSGCGVVQSNEEQFGSTTCMQQTQAQNKHQVFVKSTTDSREICNSICKSISDLNGDGVLIAILGPPCKTDGVPKESIIERTVLTNVQADSCESMLLKLAYQRAPGAKYCLYQTTYDDNSSMLVNPGASAKAINFHVRNWPHWKKGHNLHTLIVCILYGGKYKVDEEKAVNEAISSGIIIVAASGQDGLGIYPAKLGPVISVGTSSPKGRVLDFVGRSDSIYNTSISTIGVATDLALLFQKFSACKLGSYFPKIGTCAVRELLEIIAGNVSATGKDVMAIINLPKPQVRRYITQILFYRDRREIVTAPMKDDALSNTTYWSSKDINEQYKIEHEDFPHLSGKNITIAIIDEINEAFLDHLKDHSVEVHATTDHVGVKYFSFSGTILRTECCANHIQVRHGHGLQCAAIIANTAPNCTILMIIENELDRYEKVALSIVMEKKADILILSSVTTDTFIMNSFNNISAHLSCRIVLCAAGNEGKCDTTSTINYPSRAGDVIVIGACDHFGDKCPYSSCGRQVDFLCPGQFSIADSSGRGGTCYSTSAAASLIALVLEYIDEELSTAAKVKVWVSMEKEWELQTLPSLARNTHLMRALLSSSQLSLSHSKNYSSNEGFGQLLIDNLNQLTPDGISQVITNFYTVQQ